MKQHWVVNSGCKATCPQEVSHVTADKEKILSCPKLNDSRREGGRKGQDRLIR